MRTTNDRDPSAGTSGGMWLSDDGFAMAIAIAVSAVVFMLATMLITFAVYRTTQSSIQRSQAMATHMADAGLNAYIAEMRFNANYVQNDPDGLSGSQSSVGSWTVTAQQVPNAAEATLTAIGYVGKAQRTLHARITFKGFGDYAIITNAPIYFTDTDVVNWDVYANGDIRLSPLTQIKANATTAGYFRSMSSGGIITPSATQVTKKATSLAPKVTFSTATTQAAAAVASATAEGTNFATYNGGHLVEFGKPSADYVTVSKITSVNTTSNPGAMTLSGSTAYAYPASGAFTFNDDTWVKGTYSHAVTVYTAANMYMLSDINSSNPSDNTITCGLLAKQNLLWPTWVKAMTSPLTVRAAMIAQTGQISYDNISSYYNAYKTYTSNNPVDVLTQLNVSGSVGSYKQFYTQDGTDAASTHHGFKNATISYDTNLYQTAPPFWPPIGTGEIKVIKWLDY